MIPALVDLLFSRWVDFLEGRLRCQGHGVKGCRLSRGTTPHGDSVQPAAFSQPSPRPQILFPVQPPEAVGQTVTILSFKGAKLGQTEQNVSERRVRKL